MEPGRSIAVRATKTTKKPRRPLVPIRKLPGNTLLGETVGACSSPRIKRLNQNPLFLPARIKQLARAGRMKIVQGDDVFAGAQIAPGNIVDLAIAAHHYHSRIRAPAIDSLQVGQERLTTEVRGLERIV